MMTGFVQAAVVSAGVFVIQVSVDPFKWKPGQEKMYCDSMKQF